MIEAMAGLGATLQQIAIACNVSKSTVERWRADEAVELAYQRGRIQATQAVAERLFSMAMEGDVTAQIFWLKAQAGWSDRPQPEQIQQAEVHVYLPDNGRTVDVEAA